MDVIGFNFLVTNHMLKGTKGRRDRHFFYAEEIADQKIRAAEYAEEKGEDYLIVRVIEHIHPDNLPVTDQLPKDAFDRVGLYFLINKHNMKDKKLYRRTFFKDDEMEKQRKLGEKYAAENQDDFLIVEVLLEISASDTAKRRAEKARRNDRNKKP